MSSDFEIKTTESDRVLYKKISHLVDEQLEMHKGERFDLEKMCRWLRPELPLPREDRNLVSIKLAYERHHNTLEKNEGTGTYRYINKDYTVIPWHDADAGEFLDIKFPWGHEDSSRFGFDGSALISPGDIIVVAGQSNAGKTTFAQNFLWENMDNYPCFIMGNEYEASKFKRRVSRMDWANPINEDGKPKFELAKRYENWQDIIKRDHINIIDWINLEGDKSYNIGMVIQSIQSKLAGGKGIALIVIQKSPGNILGRGATYSLDLTSVYLTIDFGVMHVVKVKEWQGHNPNNDIYGFEIVAGGTKFHRIRKIKKCPKCWGSGHVHGAECEDCLKTGYIDA